MMYVNSNFTFLLHKTNSQVLVIFNVGKKKTTNVTCFVTYSILRKGTIASSANLQQAKCINQFHRLNRVLFTFQIKEHSDFVRIHSV